jgi:hypothetical protein
MRSLAILAAAAAALFAAPSSLAAPAASSSLSSRAPGENLCHLSSPPQLCVPDPNITVEETARRAYQFYRAFVVDGDPRAMFALIDDVYIVSDSPLFGEHHPLYMYLCMDRREFWGLTRDDNHFLATQPLVPQRPAGHLAPVLQRTVHRQRADHQLVL